MVGAEGLAYSDHYATGAEGWSPARIVMLLYELLREAMSALAPHTRNVGSQWCKGTKIGSAGLGRSTSKALKRLAAPLDSVVDNGLRAPTLHPDVLAHLLATNAVNHRRHYERGSSANGRRLDARG